MTLLCMELIQVREGYIDDLEVHSILCGPCKLLTVPEYNKPLTIKNADNSNGD